jgi:GlpG protein
VIPKSPPLTIALVAVSIFVYLLMSFGPQQAIIAPLLISEYIRPTLPEILEGEVWRLVTPVFLHFGIFHITFNMLWTWELGRLIEWRQGAITLGVLTLLSGIAANLSQYLVSGPLFGGMSGVIYAYLGYVWIQGHTNPAFGVRINPAIVKLMLGWFVLCWSGILEKFLGLSVANTAHTAGLVTGIVAALAVSAQVRISRGSRKQGS